MKCVLLLLVCAVCVVTMGAGAAAGGETQLSSARNEVQELEDSLEGSFQGQLESPNAFAPLVRVERSPKKAGPIAPKRPKPKPRPGPGVPGR